MDSEKLVIYNNQIYETVGGKPLNRVLDIPNIKIVDKISYSLTANNKAEVRFKLNNHTDAEWRHIFNQHCDEKKYRFEGDNLIALQVEPPSLQDEVLFLKNAIDLSNEAYDKLKYEMRQILVKRLADEERNKIEGDNEKQEAEKIIKASFDNLQI